MTRLILEDLTDSTARKSRALLELRLGQADRAVIDLTALLEGRTSVKNRHEVLAAALACLLDAGPGQSGRRRCGGSCTAKGRVLGRNACYSGRFWRPGAGKPPARPARRPACVPRGRAPSDHRRERGRSRVEKTVQARPDSTLRDSLNRAVLLAVLGRKRAAIDACTQALRASPQSPRTISSGHGSTTSWASGCTPGRMSRRAGNSAE